MSTTNVAARYWQTIPLDQYDLPSSTWCMWLQVWLGAAIYDLPVDSADIIFPTCSKVINFFGRHLLAKFCNGYGRTTRIDKIARASREKALVESSISSRLEETAFFTCWF